MSEESHIPDIATAMDSSPATSTQGWGATAMSRWQAENFCVVPDMRGFPIAADSVPGSHATTFGAAPAMPTNMEFGGSTNMPTNTEFGRLATVRTTAADVFGATSIKPVAEVPPTRPAGAFSASYAYQGIVLLILVGYLYCVFRHRGQAMRLLKSIFSPAGDAIRRDEHEIMPADFTAILFTTGILALGVAVVRIVALFETPGPVAPYPGETPWMGVVAVSAAMCMVMLLQRAVLVAVGVVTLSGGIVKALTHFRRMFFMAAAIVVVPFVLLMALSPEGLATGVAWPMGMAGAALGLLYIFSLLLLFMEQKVSVLFWFLYLCTVELLPPAVLITIALRSVAHT